MLSPVLWAPRWLVLSIVLDIANSSSGHRCSQIHKKNNLKAGRKMANLKLLHGTDYIKCVTKLKGMEPDSRPKLDKKSAVRLLEILEKEAKADAAQDRVFDILKLIFEYGFESQDSTKCVNLLITNGLVETLCTTAKELFLQSFSLRRCCDQSLVAVSKFCLSIMEEFPRVRRKFRPLIDQIYQSLGNQESVKFHSTTVYHVMQLLELLLGDKSLGIEFCQNIHSQIRMLLVVSFYQAKISAHVFEQVCRIICSLQSEELEETMKLASVHLQERQLLWAYQEVLASRKKRGQGLLSQDAKFLNFWKLYLKTQFKLDANEFKFCGGKFRFNGLEYSNVECLMSLQGLSALLRVSVP
mmetsp:Transcript_89233/g.238349  ORF Transcript_89233/g.238349 Transcript_89233/m.238349 type:complete len:355 (+) Transcript_89233:1367-2431(+)